MDEQPIPPEPGLPAAEAHPHLPSARRVKRRLMAGLIGLYALSLLAACLLILRSPAPSPSEGGERGKGLLSLAQKDSVGWVSIHGPIYSSEDGRPWEKGAELWVRRIRAMAETKGVKAIVLDINSPGGSVGAVQEIHSQILRVRKEKNIPVVALFDDIAASGGYYIAAACDQIVAHPGSLTGSIGVIFSVSNLEGLFKKVGYKTEPIKSGKHKDIGSPARPMTPEERSLLQALIDDAYAQFVQAVSLGRRLPEDKVRLLADGRIFSGRQALEDKLVDKLGDSTDAIELAGRLGGISGKPRVKRDVDRISEWFGLLDARFQGSLSLGSSLLSGLTRPHAGLEYRWSGW